MKLAAGLALAAGLTLAPGTWPGVGSPAASWSGPVTADTAHLVIDRVLAAYGGAEAVRAVRSLRQEGLVVTTGAGEHGTTVRIAHCPDRLALVVEYASRSEIRILDERGGWQGASPSALSAASAPMQAAMALQAARACLPGTLDAYRSTARIETDAVPPGGVRETFGALTVLGLEVAPGLGLRIWVSDETGLVLRSESVLAMGAMTMTFASDYADFRPVDGVMFPFREESFASGAHTATIRLNVIEVNPEGDRARLPLPGGPS